MKKFTTIRNNDGLTIAQLKVSVPSVFATRAATKMSDRYAFVPTIKVVEGLIKEGFRVVEAGQRSTSKRDPRYTRHMLRLRSPKAKPILGDTFPELLMTNSHDGQSRLFTGGGFFRLICTNGLVASMGPGTSLSSVHRGDAAVLVKEAMKVADSLPTLQGTVEKMTQKKLTEKERGSFAIAAAKSAYGESPSFDPQLLLAVRRTADEGSDVWSIFNRIQENIMQGGVSFESRATHRTFSTRGITHIGRSLEVNTTLWALAEKLVA